MIDWWGPIFNEFFGASDVGGFTLITGPEWIGHRGSVGRPLSGVVEIRDADGVLLPAREIGEIYMGTGEITSSTGDIGYLDDDGYLYHVDRKSNIVSIAGVDFHPEQLEATLIAHPAVADVAVINAIGVASLTAAVEALHWPPAVDLAENLAVFYAQSSEQTRVPLNIQFVRRLPRAATGKLYRNQITFT